MKVQLCAGVLPPAGQQPALLPSPVALAPPSPHNKDTLDLREVGFFNFDIGIVTSPGTIFVACKSFIDRSMGGLVSKDINTHGGWRKPKMIKISVSSRGLNFHQRQQSLALILALARKLALQRSISVLLFVVNFKYILEDTDEDVGYIRTFKEVLWLEIEERCRNNITSTF